MIDDPWASRSRRSPSTRAAAGAGLSFEVGGDGVALLEFDQPDAEHNRFTPELLERLAAVLDELAAQAAEGRLEGVVVTSAKVDSFLLGVDVAAIAAVDSIASARAATRRGQEVFQKLAVLPVTSVAAINGTCLGGATEMALACTWRIAADSAATRIGLPEVSLGIFPGFGGSQILPRTISIERALQMILSGTAVDARRARKIGLVDDVVPAPILVAEARRRALETTRPRRRRSAPEDRGLVRRARRWLLEGQPLGRAILFRQAGKRVASQTAGQYPAPVAALDTIRRGLRMPLQRGLELEAKRVGDLIVSPVARNLLGVFLSRQAARRAARPAAPGATREPGVGDATGAAAVCPVAKLAVVGAGVMGGGIAQLAAYHGVRVRMKDVAGEALARGFATAHQRFLERQRAGRMSAAQVADRMALISATLDYSGFSTADLVIEAVVERLDVKRTVLAEVEAATPAGCVLATNTSSLTLAEIGASLQRPGRLVGLHFFNPVHRMPLVEVVRGPGSDADAVGVAAAFAHAMGKVPVVVGDAPGFFVNRVLTPYLNEALLMVEAGVPIDRVDRALTGFGMPMGPLRLLDEIGLDVSSHVADQIAPLFAGRMPTSTASARLRDAGRSGKKSGLGFYKYGSGSPAPDADVERLLQESGSATERDTAPTDADIVDRCVLLMLNETCLALAEDIVESPQAADLALVMGIGFAPFRGGVLRYADEVGAENICSRLRALQERHGTRFEPAPLLLESAASGRGLYPRGWPASGT